MRGTQDADTAFWRNIVTDSLAAILCTVPKDKAHVVMLKVVSVTTELVCQLSHTSALAGSQPDHQAPTTAPAPAVPVPAAAAAKVPPPALPVTLPWQLGLPDAITPALATLTKKQWATVQRL